MRLRKRIPYKRLLYLARKMHLEIFLLTVDEQEIYDKIGFTDEENAILGYSGKFYIKGTSDKDEKKKKNKRFF